MSDHWHIATGLAGYGPDAPDYGFNTATDLDGLAEAIRYELASIIDFETDGAHSLADSGDYKSAWLMLMHADELDTLATNLRSERAAAPLYADRPDLWRAEILRLVSENFPLDYDEGRCRLYVWQCEETLAECESTPDEIRAEAMEDMERES